MYFDKIDLIKWNEIEIDKVTWIKLVQPNWIIERNPFHSCLFIWHTTHADVRKLPTYRNYIFTAISGQIWRTKKSTYDIWKNICRTLLQCMEPVCICTMENVPLKVVSNWPQKLHFVLHAAAALSALVKVKFVKTKFVKKFVKFLRQFSKAAEKTWSFCFEYWVMILGSYSAFYVQSKENFND